MDVCRLPPPAATPTTLIVLNRSIHCGAISLRQVGRVRAVPASSIANRMLRHSRHSLAGCTRPYTAPGSAGVRVPFELSKCRRKFALVPREFGSNICDELHASWRRFSNIEIIDGLISHYVSVCLIWETFISFTM